MDDLIITGNNPDMIANFKQDMMNQFETTDLGVMNYFLGIEVDQRKEVIFICQKKYANNVLKKFNMEHCKPVSTPLAQSKKLSKNDDSREVDVKLYRSMIGSLLYLTATRSDMMYSVSMLSKFMNKPTQIHLQAIKRVLRYLKGTLDYRIWYRPIINSDLIGYSDNDWVGSIDDMNSTSGYVFSLGNGVFSWLSQKQDTTAQSNN